MSAVITNGTIKLGVRDEGHLNIPGVGIPSRPSSSTTAVGLRLIFPDGSESEATAPGCLCEGFGVAADGVSGYANVAIDGVVNLSMVAFGSTASTAIAVADLPGKVRVTHDYVPSTATPFLYEVTVILENISGGPISDLRYRRVMDWDISPTTFSEFVTIDTGTAADVLFSSDNGFATANPLAPAGSILFVGDAVDSGPADHGAIFDFKFADITAATPLADGDSRVFTIFYGAAFNEPDAIGALAAVGAEVFSFGQPNVTPPPDHGEPNTFIFAFAGVGGAPIFPDCTITPDTALNPPGSEHCVDIEVTESGEVAVGAEASVSVSGVNTVPATDLVTPVEFCYTSDGTPGFDTISASGTLINDVGQEFDYSCSADKFWDEDCQPNGIADTCDLDCNGFGGACNVPGCGLSADANGDGQPDECNLPPDCSSASSDPDELWPPNHKFRDISVGDVTDPDGDPIAITIDSIFQDEPTDDLGDGKTCPDGAGVGLDTASVRAERSGNKRVPGDGRVYHIGFTADDGRGGECSGTITACVPHDQRPGHVCVDQGPLFDSTVCGQ